MKAKKQNNPVQPAKPAAVKYSIEKLRQNCTQLFNVSGSTFAGATYGLKGKYSIKEMEQIIKDWKGKGVK